MNKPSIKKSFGSMGNAGRRASYTKTTKNPRKDVSPKASKPAVAKAKPKSEERNDYIKEAEEHSIVAINIGKVMSAKNVGLNTLSKSTGIDVAGLSRYRSGKSKIPLLYARKICVALGVTIDSLFIA
jgi:DNA-binding Xre family transcriptional regulator